PPRQPSSPGPAPAYAGPGRTQPRATKGGRGPPRPCYSTPGGPSRRVPMSAALDPTTPVRPGEELPLARLEAYLREHLPPAEGPPAARGGPAGGGAVPAGARDPGVFGARGGRGGGPAPPAVRQPGEDRPRHGPRAPRAVRAVRGLPRGPAAKPVLRRRGRPW